MSFWRGGILWITFCCFLVFFVHKLHKKLHFLLVYLLIPSEELMHYLLSVFNCIYSVGHLFNLCILDKGIVPVLKLLWYIILCQEFRKKTKTLNCWGWKRSTNVDSSINDKCFGSLLKLTCNIWKSSFLSREFSTFRKCQRDLWI